MKDEMLLRGMRENNLKHIDLTLPKEKLMSLPVFPVQGKVPWSLIP